MWRDFFSNYRNRTDTFLDRLNRLQEMAEEPVKEPIAPLQPAETGRLTFQLVDISGGVGEQEVIADLSDGAVIDPALLEGRTVTIVASNAAQDVGSVRLFYQELNENGGRVDSQFKVENFEPFALFGDNNGDFRQGLTFDEGGTFSLSSDAFTGDNARGLLLERQVINFTVAEPTPANNAPVAANDTLALDANENGIINVLANDRDADGDSLTLTRLVNVGEGISASIRDGRIAIDPDSNFVGNATIRYEVSDGNGGLSAADVTVTVAPPAPAPTPTPLETAEVRFFLVDIRGGADEQKVLVELTDGAVIEADTLGDAPVTIFATTQTQSLESLRLNFSGQSEDGQIETVNRVENTEPYTLLGDNSGDVTQGISNFGEGSYSVGYEAFDQNGANGRSLGQDSINFTVVDSTPDPTPTPPQPTPAPAPAPTPVEPAPNPGDTDPFANGVLSSYTSGGDRATSFNIDLNFTGPGWTVDLQRAFVNATEFLSSVIIGDATDKSARFGRPAVDDVQIDVNLEAIDGQNGTLAFAGPRAFFQSDDTPGFGSATFDTADAARLNSNGALDDVIVHEFFHVLGFGTLFNSKGLLENDRFTGEFATQLYNDVYREYSDRDPGSARGLPTQEGGGHFDEGIFRDELNTPSLDFRGNSISGLSIAALEDLGYDTYLNNPFDPNDAFSAAPENTITGNDLFTA